MVWFNQRRELLNRYRNWLSKNPEIYDCPFNVISFLNSCDLFDEEAVADYLLTDKDKEAIDSNHDNSSLEDTLIAENERLKKRIDKLTDQLIKISGMKTLKKCREVVGLED